MASRVMRVTGFTRRNNPKVIHGIIPQSQQRTQHTCFRSTMRLFVAPVHLFLYACTMCHFTQIVKQHGTEVKIDMCLAEHLPKVLYHQINNCGFT